MRPPPTLCYRKQIMTAGYKEGFTFRHHGSHSVAFLNPSSGHNLGGSEEPPSGFRWRETAVQELQSSFPDAES